MAAWLAGAEVDDDGPVLTFCCRPHNPTGALVPLPHDRPLVVDEAYFEFAGDSAVGLEGVVVIRTFSKAFGLAAARVGYAVDAETAGELRVGPYAAAHVLREGLGRDDRAALPPLPRVFGSRVLALSDARLGLRLALEAPPRRIVGHVMEVLIQLPTTWQEWTHDDGRRRRRVRRAPASPNGDATGTSAEVE